MKLAFLITTYNRPESLMNLINEIKDLGDIYVVDDGSDEKLNLSGINYLYKENDGKKGFYKTVTALWNMVRDKDYDYYFNLQDDGLPVKNFAYKAIRDYINIMDGRKIALNLFREQSRDGRVCWTGFPPLDCGHVIQTQWLDMWFMCERKFYEVINWEVPEQKRDWESNPDLGSGVGSYISRYMNRRGYSIYLVKKSLLFSQESAYQSRMNSGENTKLYKAIM